MSCSVTPAGIMSTMPANNQGIQPERYQLIPRVLVFITCERHVLLLKGAPTKRIWANKYNGVGGHVERGEDCLSAARREIAEETGLLVDNLHFCGQVNIDAGQPIGISMFVFTAAVEERAGLTSPDGLLAWVPFDRILELDLVEDLPILLPRVLSMGSAPPFFGQYAYDADRRLQIRFADG
jgi:8-oxo-dGTP diphosphatase